MAGPTELLAVREVKAFYGKAKDWASDVADGIRSSAFAVRDYFAGILDSTDRDQTARAKEQMATRIPEPETETHDPLSEVRIGLSWFTVPPGKIRIREARHNEDIPGLRTSSNALVKTGRGQIRVDMELDFPDANAINDHLRTLIAQFRASPFVPVESHYIANAVYARAASVDAKAIDTIILKLERVYQDYTALQEEMVERLLSRPSIVYWYGFKHNLDDAATAVRFRQMLPRELDDVVTLAMAGPQSDEFDQFDLHAYGEVHRSYLKTKKLIEKIKDLHSQLVELGIAETSKRPVVPCILHEMEVSTVPNEVHSLKVNLSMIYFAHQAFVPDLVYKNAMGTPTLDLHDCPFYKMYLERRFLNSNTTVATLKDEMSQGYRYLGTYNQEEGSNISFEYPTPKFVEVDEDDADQRSNARTTVSADKIWGRAANIVGLDAAGKKFKNLTDTLTITDTDRNIVPAQIIVTLKNRIGLQPIQGNLYGAAQHLGAMNAQVQLLFHVTGETAPLHNEAMAKIQRMKLDSEKVAQALGPRVRRNHKIAVNNNVLHLMGVRFVQIDGLTSRTVPGEVFSSVVSMEMTEYTVSQEEREGIRRALPDRQGSLIEPALQECAETADEYLRGELSTPRGSKAANSDLGLYCRTALYGNSQREGIITRRVVMDMYLDKPTVITAVRKYLIAEEVKKRQAEAARRADLNNPYRTRSMAISKETQDMLSDAFKDVRGALLERRHQMQQWARPAMNAHLLALDGPANVMGIKAKITNKHIHQVIGELADETVAFWAKSKIAVEGLEQEPTFKKDKRGIVDLSSVPYVSEIYGSILKPEFPQELSRLRALADWAVKNLPRVRDYANSRDDDARRRSNYPDMELPTYAEMFLTLGDAFIPEGTAREETERLSRVALLQEDVTLAGLGPRMKEVLRRFMPTYRDQGKRPPYYRDLYDIAKGFYDVVDPDFYYFHYREALFFDSLTDRIEGEVDAIYEPSNNVFRPSKGQALEDARNNKIAQRVQRLRSNLPTALHKTLKGDPHAAMNMDLIADPDASVPRMKFIDGAWQMADPALGYGNTPEFNYAPSLPQMQEAMGKFVHNDPRHLKALFRETQEARKDDAGRMLRAFPAFRLSFIELDNENWGYWDDFYGYNAVAGIRLSEHKFEPDLLELKIINTTGNLEEERFYMQDPDRRAEQKVAAVDENNREYNNSDDVDEKEEITGEEQWLDHFFLQVGTNVMLELGYGADKEDLKSKFTGQVVEIRPGDMMTVVCQGYANELTVPLSTHKKGAWSDPWDVINYVMEESPTVHFGQWSPYETGLLFGLARDGSSINTESTERLGWMGYRRGPEGDDEASEHARSLFGGGTAAGTRADIGIGIAAPPVGLLELYSVTAGGGTTASSIAGDLGAVINEMVSYTTTRKMGNVYLPRASGMHEVTRTGREFVIPDRTGLEVLQELTRHLPGYCFGVREYDHRATLFFGKPEQRYFYTSRKQDEEKRWREYKGRAEKKAKSVFKDVITRFESSIQGQAAMALLNNRHGTWDTLKSSLAKSVGRLPGKIIGTLTLGLFGGETEEQGARLGQKYMDGAEKSADSVTALDEIEAKLGRTNLQFLACYFFNRWSQGHSFIDSAASDLLDWVVSGGPINPRSTARVGRDLIINAGAEFADTDRTEFSNEFLAGIDDAPGSILVSLLDWRGKVEAISTKNDGTVEWNDRLRYEVFDLSTDVKRLDVTADKNSGVVTAAGRQIKKGPYMKAVDSIISYIPDWKAYIDQFQSWLQLQIALGDTDTLKEAYRAGQQAAKHEFNPRTKRFRNHHYVDDRRHIIKNEIIATKEQMANTVVIKYTDDITSEKAGDRVFVPADAADESWELMVDENIVPSEKKVRIITEVNIESGDKAKLAAYANLAQALRPMYRGQLILRGDEAIEPYDIVWITDRYENMHGPVEVERVLTNFSAETGYTSTVIPELVAIPMSSSSWMDAMVCGMVNSVSAMAKIAGMGQIGSTSGAVAGAMFGPIGMIGGSLIGSGTALIGTTIKESADLKEETGTRIWGNLMGNGRYGRMKTPVDFIPLMKNGIPWTAGLKGFGEGNWKLRLMKRWTNLKRGFKMAKKALNKIRQDVR
jgi:hypothetical protein